MSEDRYETLVRAQTHLFLWLFAVLTVSVSAILLSMGEIWMGALFWVGAGGFASLAWADVANGINRSLWERAGYSGTWYSEVMANE